MKDDTRKLVALLVARLAASNDFHHFADEGEFGDGWYMLDSTWLLSVDEEVVSITDGRYAIVTEDGEIKAPEPLGLVNDRLADMLGTRIAQLHEDKRAASDQSLARRLLNLYKGT